jgi:general secretion pathway protein I
VSSARRTAGFTLLEVLMALVIFAFAATILAGTYLNVLNSYDIVARSTVVDADLAYARSIVLTEPDVKKLEKGGEFATADGRNVRWSVEILPTTVADLFTVNFTCELGESGGGETRKATETFTVYRPTWSVDPAARSQLKQDAKNRILEFQAKKTS